MATPTPSRGIEHANYCWGATNKPYVSKLHDLFGDKGLVVRTLLKQIVEIHRQVTWKDLWHCREGVQLLKGEVEPPYDAWTGVKNNIVQIWNKTDPKIRLLAGSDAPNYVMGFGLHREIENFAFMGHVYTGSTPQQARWRALQSATTEAGEFLTESSPYLIKTDQKYGGISVGTSADSDDGDFGNIVIIDGDPIGGGHIQYAADNRGGLSR